MVGVTKSLTALLSAFIGSKKMKVTSKITDSTSPAYKRGVIILGQTSARALKGLAPKQTKKNPREKSKGEE